MMKPIKLVTFIISILGTFVLTYANDQSWKIFDDTRVGEVRIIIEPAYLEYLLAPENAESDSLFPVILIYKNAVIHGDTLADVGFRIRGNTSRESAKKSFRMDINHFVSGRQFYDLEKLNLNGEHNDPSIIRSKLCWDLFNKIGVPASRANHVILYINNEYRGLYINIEHIDDEFVQKRFGNQNGNLYKCLYPADLVYLGPDQEAYKQYYWGRQAYELKTNKEENDYSDLIHFIDVLNNTPQAKFKQEIEKVFHVENFLKWLAMNVLDGSWDDYWYLKNNYYLYHNTATEQFQFIPYDYDNTYGIDWIGVDWGTRDIYHWGNSGEERPLVTRILNVPEYHNAYTHYLSDFIEDEFAFENQVPRIDQLKLMITPAAEADKYRTMDWGFTIEDFHKSYEQSIAVSTNHVPYGLKPYISTRIVIAKAQLNFVTLPPNITKVIHTPQWPKPDEPVTITAKVEDDELLYCVKLFYRTTTTNFQSILMEDDGNHNDDAPDDKIFGATIPSQPHGTVVYYYIEAMDNRIKFVKDPATAPDNAYFYVSRYFSENDVPINLHLKKSIDFTDVGIGLLGSFNDWNKIYTMKNEEDNLWQISIRLPEGQYIFKFVTYQNLNGQSGITEWIADPENPDRDGPPYYNTVLNVSNPMIYYVKPINNVLVFTAKPEISAEFSCSMNSDINSQSLVFKIDDNTVDNAWNYYDAVQRKLLYLPPMPLIRGAHIISLNVRNYQGDYTEKSSQFSIECPLLFINELMAVNDNFIADEFGEYDDWVEIYNGDTADINLRGMYLTDDLWRPQKWILPNVTIEAGGFLLIWADGDTTQGSFHANFKLSGSGERLGLFTTEATGIFIIDSLSFGAQTTNISCGRYPDGNSLWQFFVSPTPGYANTATTISSTRQNTVPDHFELWQNYPNPFNSKTTINFALPKQSQVAMTIFNVSGQLINTLVNKKLTAGYYSLLWDGQNNFGREVSGGLYFYQINVDNFLLVRKMILLR